MPPRKRLGQLLTELGVVDEHQLQSALGHQKQWGGKLGAILVQKGFCKEEEMVSALSRHLGMPRVRLVEQKVDPRAIKFVARPIAEKLHVFAYEVSGSGRSEVVTIAMSDPTDLSAVDQLAFHTGKRIKPMLAGDSEIVSAIAEHYGADEQPRVAPRAEPPVMAPQPSLAGPSGPFGRRVDPPSLRTPPGNVARLTPVMTPVWSPAKAAEEAPASPPRSPVDLPATGADESLPLEPIAAHSQTEAVQGQTDFSGAGSAADRVEGLEPAGNAQAVAQENWSSGGWDAGQSWGAPPEAPTPSSDWGAPPAEPLPDWGDQPTEAAWGEAHEESALPEAAQPESQPEDALPEETAYEAQPSETADEPLPEETTYEAHAGAEEVTPEAHADDAAHASGEELPVDAILGTAEESHAHLSASEEPGHTDDSAEAPDAWGATEDPLAAQDTPAFHAGDAAHAAGDAFAEASHEGFDAAGAPGEAQDEEPADEQGFDIEESEPAASDAEHAEWGTAEPSAAEEAETETVAAGDATVEMEQLAREPEPEPHAEPSYAAAEEHAEVAYAAAEPHAEASYAPAARAYAAADPDASPAESATTPVFGMVPPDDAGTEAIEAGAETSDAGEPPDAGFEAHVAVPEEAEHFEDAGDVPMEWSEPPHPGEAPLHESPPDQVEREDAYLGTHLHAGVTAHEPADFTPQEHSDFTAHEAESPAEHAPGEASAERWDAPVEGHDAGWSAEPAASSALSAADLTTLSAAGIDPHDPAAALRLLASLVRALERKGILDLAELAAEVHESTAQAAAPAEDVPPA
ncbi:MAG TPA: hypothetical protein VGH20_08290 [Myxococcales bacterium]|jgi:hypothetical protein